MIEMLGTKKVVNFNMGDDCILRFKSRVCIPQAPELKGLILDEGHKRKLSLLQGTTKMYQDLKKMFWWFGMKKDVTDYMAACLACQKAKVENHSPGGLLQTIEIPEWKWETIIMDFVTHTCQDLLEVVMLYG